MRDAAANFCAGPAPQLHIAPLFCRRADLAEYIRAQCAGLFIFRRRNFHFPSPPPDTPLSCVCVCVFITNSIAYFSGERASKRVRDLTFINYDNNNNNNSHNST